MIAIRNLSTGYNKWNPALLSGFTFTFENRIYGILGESGCGKTTLLRTIAGLTKPLSGSIEINGKPASQANRSEVYMMHQNYTCFDWMNCLDNILIAKKIKGYVTEEDRRDAREMLNAVRLDGQEEKYPRQLSGGMRQRLALARTLFVKPEIILMDEPLSALDFKTRAEMQQLIMNLHKETQNTIIMVTHSQAEAEKMCDEIIKL